MEMKPLTMNLSTNFNLFLSETIQQDFDEILIFLCEITGVSDAFISINRDGKQIIQSKIGLKNCNKPNEISCFKDFVNSNQNLIVSDLKNKSSILLNTKEGNVYPFDFFAGFPIKINTLFTGSICILKNDSRELSEIELKTIQQSVARIESMLLLYSQNQSLQNTIKHNKEKFIFYEENSNEILYQINSEGIFTYVSRNWTVYLGHELHEVIGKCYSDFIHPEDMESWQNYFNTIPFDIKNTTDIVYRALHNEGYYVWHSSRMQRFKKDGVSFFIGNCTDINTFVENEQKLVQQKDFYETILNSLPTDVVVFDTNHRYVYLNPIAIKNDELRAFIIGKDDFEYAKHMGRDFSSAVTRREKFNFAKQNKKIAFWEETLTNPIDGVTYHDRKITPVFNTDGTFKMMIGFSVNITESKKIQLEILQSRELIKNILNNTAVGILIQGPNTEIIEYNDAACQMLGLNHDQLMGITSYDPSWSVIHENETPFKPENHPVPTAIRTLKPVNNVVLGVRRPKHKDLIWLLVDAVPVIGADNKLQYVICSFNNITIQKNIKEDLKISNERFTYVTKATSDVIWDWEVGSKNIIIGENYTKLFGHKINNKNNFLKVTNFNKLIHPDDLQRVLESIKTSLESEANTWYDEFRFLKSDGTYAYLTDKACIIRDKSNKAIRMIGAQKDITIKKKVIKELRISEERFKGAFEHSGLGMAIVDSNGYYIETNDRLSKILGYSKDELKKRTFISLTHPEDLAEDLANKERLDLGLVSNFSSEKRFIHKDKSIVWTNMHVSSVTDDNGVIHYIPQIIDITDRKKIEVENDKLLEEINISRNMQLNEAKNLYRLLAENTIDLVCLHNLDATFQYVSPSVQNLLGYSPQELIGKSPLEYTHPEDVDNLKQRIYGFISEQEDVAAQVRLRHFDGHYIWFESKAKLVKVDDVPVSFHSGTREITAQKEAEESIKHALRKEKKLNDLRTNLVSTISHEFRTPMTTIRTSAELIEMYIEDQPIANADRLEKHLHTITNEIDRIVELMNTVLTISKEDAGKTNFQPVYFDLKQVCLDVIETSYSNQKDGRKVQTNFYGDVFPVFADKNLMEYSLFNLLNNAFKYSVGCGDVSLNLFRKETSIIVEIIDNGIGIPESDQKKLFNTFFRASNTDGIQGTGLGLYIVKTFTEKNSGVIHLESKKGKGTKVTLSFPLHIE